MHNTASADSGGPDRHVVGGQQCLNVGLLQCAGFRATDMSASGHGMDVLLPAERMTTTEQERRMTMKESLDRLDRRLLPWYFKAPHAPAETLQEPSRDAATESPEATPTDSDDADQTDHVEASGREEEPRRPRRKLGLRLGRRTVQADVVEVPRAYLEELRDEAARLRLEQHRPLNLAQVGRSARALADAASTDEAWHVVAEGEALRASLVGVLRDLQTASSQLQQQLETGTPAAELDRRVALDRRRLHVAVAPPGAVNFSEARLTASDSENNDLVVLP